MNAWHVLLAAADLIDTEGWIQGAEENADGFCVVGALLAVDDRDAATSRYVRTRNVRDLVRQALGGWSIAEWNDTVCKSKREAIDALLWTAATLDEEP